MGPVHAGRRGPTFEVFRCSPKWNCAASHFVKPADHWNNSLPYIRFARRSRWVNATMCIHIYGVPIVGRGGQVPERCRRQAQKGPEILSPFVFWTDLRLAPARGGNTAAD
jgi:hypothetical protein